MKKQLLLALFALCIPWSAWADVEIDGIYYNLITKTKQAEVTNGGTTGRYSGNIVIPSSVEYEGVTYSVTTIYNEAFKDCSSLTGITIPNSVTSVGDFSFSNNDALSSVTIPNSVTSMGDFVFRDCDGLRSVTIGDGVSSIGAYVFESCNYLNMVTIGNSVTSIGSGAFHWCNNLTSVTMGNSVKNIGSRAFYGCYRLKSINIPSSVKTIGSDAFNCSGYTTSLESVNIEDIYAWCNIEFDDFYSNPLNIAHRLYLNGMEVTDLVIPDGVTSIGAYAFYKCTSLSSVNIPDGVTNIGDNAFYGCSSLISVNIPYGITQICANTFRDCSSLKSISIPNSVAVIGFRAFSNCSSLTSVEIPNSVYYIDGYAFNECSVLETVTLGSGVTQIGSGSSYTINGITRQGAIGNSFALCKNLTTVKCLAENVPNTDVRTFNESLVEYATLYVPEGSVDSYRNTSPWSSFGTVKALTDDGCNAPILVDGIYFVLDDENGTATVVSGDEVYSGIVTIPTSVMNDGKTYTVVAIGEGTFQNAADMTAISIPSSVTSIGDNAFVGCNNLISVTVAWETPIVINSTVFPNSGNATLHVPSGSESAYASADSWKDFKTIAEPIVFADNAVKALCLANWDADGDGVLYMDEAAIVTDLDSVFTDNTDITTFDELQYFTGLTSVGERAFYYCSNLTSIVIPDNVTTIGNRAFYVCSGLTSLHISANVTNIEDRAFAYCSELESIVVDDGNTVYDSRNDCNALIKTSDNTLLIGCKSTVIPSGVKILAEGAFRGCAELTNIEIPEGVTTIGTNAFRGCTGLESVTLPSTITSIGTYAFSAFDEVYNLTTVTVGMATPVTITSSVFPNRANSTLYVPKGTKELYETAKYWKEFKDIVEIEEEPEKFTTWIPYFNRGSWGIEITYKFINPEELTCQVIDAIGGDVVEIPSEILGESIMGMSYQIRSIAGITSNMKVLSLPSTITSISDTAFYKCNNLKAVIANMEEPCPIASTTFTNKSNITLYVPLGCKAKYEAMNYWKDFMEILELAEIDSGIYYLQNVEADTILWNEPFYISKRFYDRYDIRCLYGNVEDYIPFLLRGGEYEYGEYVCDGDSIYIGDMDRDGGGWTVTVDGENTYRIQSFLRDNMYGAAMFPLDTFLGFTNTNIGFYSNEANIHWKLLPYNDVQRHYLRQFELPVVIQTANQLGIDTTDADRLYQNESADADDVEETIRVLREIIKNKLPHSGASYGNPVELTGLIQNPSFAWGSDYGWESYWYYAYYGGHDFQSHACYYNSATFNQYQTITGIANGLYQVKVLSNNYGGNCYLYANNDSIRIISDSISICRENTLIVNVTDGTLSIGVVGESNGSSIYGNYSIFLDNFQLYYLGRKDQLYSTNMTAHVGSQTSIPVMLANENEFGGLKFLLSLPEGVTLSKIEKTERLDKTIQVTFDKVSDNKYQIIIFNMSRKSILGNEGELLMLKVNLSKDMEIGKHEIQMSEIVASDLDLNEIELADSRCTLNVENNNVVITDISDMDNAFYMDEKSVIPGNRYVLPIKLKNNQLVMGFQFDLELPEGVSFALDDNGRVIATMSDRGSTFSISKNKRSDRVCRFVVMDASNNVLTGEDGVVMNVTVDVADNIEVGVYGVVFKNGELTTKEDNAISSILLQNVTAPMNVVAALMGDVNNDGRVSVTDVVAIVGYILGNKFTNFVKAAADLNGDGSITVVDVVSVINLILNDDSYSKANALFEVEEE